MDKLSLEEFIYQVKQELLEAQNKHEGEFAYFNLQNVEIEVSVAVNREGSGKVNIYVAELGADVARELTHTVKLSFNIVTSESEETGMGSKKSEKKEKKGETSRGGTGGPGVMVGKRSRYYR